MVRFFQVWGAVFSPGSWPGFFFFRGVLMSGFSCLSFSDFAALPAVSGSCFFPGGVALSFSGSGCVARASSVRALAVSSGVRSSVGFGSGCVVVFLGSGSSAFFSARPWLRRR